MGALSGRGTSGLRSRDNVETRTAVHDAARVQVLHARRDLPGDVQHLAHGRRVVLRPLATAQEPPVHRRLRRCGRSYIMD